MSEASIPVDLLNPGQVFACLGFLEAAEVLCGNAEGSFDWKDDSQVRFVMSADGDVNPFEEVLKFLTEAKPQRFGHVGYKDPPPKDKKTKTNANDWDEVDSPDDPASADDASVLELGATFPAKKGERMALPIKFGGGNRPMVVLGHWADGTDRNKFKLYSGNRSAQTIARGMLQGVHKKRNGKKNKAKHKVSDLDNVMRKGISQLWLQDQSSLIAKPFHILTPMGGSFNFDPRGAWTSIDAGYSPDQHNHAVEASPVVEFLASWGLENARPVESRDRKCGYSAWDVRLPPMLARAALCGAISTIPSRSFTFHLGSSGKNSIVTFAREELGT